MTTSFDQLRNRAFNKRFILMLIVMLGSVTGAWAQMTFIKEVKVRVGAKDKYTDLTSEGYTVISGPGETYFDFNGGGTGGDYVYIGYKTTTNPNEAISDLAVVYNDDHTGTSTAYGSDDFLYGGSKTMMIGNKRYYLAPHIGGPDMNTGNKKHENCVYLYYTRDVDTSDGMRLLTTLGGERWGSRHTTVPSGWDSMIRGYMGNGQPKTTGGSTYEVTYDAARVFGDTNEAGGGDYTYILCNYVSGIYYVDIDRKAKLPNAVTEITNASSTLSAGWYIVRGQNVQTGTLTCNGAVNIILADDAKLTATGQANNAGIQVSAAGSSLAIYGQTAQSGQLTAIGGTGASAIDGGSPGAASPIYVNTSLTVCADGNNPPTTFVDYTIGEDVSGSLSGKRYVTMRIPKNITVTLDRQGGTGGATQVTVDEGSAMPTISVPTRTGYTFHGYYASKNGTGTKYYNADGTSAHKWDRTSTATLYAHWTPNQYTVTFDMQNGIGGTESVTATYDDAMPEITIPTREDYAFLGYFSQPYGRGTKYYNADGTSAQAWNITSNTTLYAQWEVVRAWYIDADGSSKSVTDFTTITDKSETTTLSSGWYIVYEADVQTRTLVCEGAVHLILMDGAKLTATGGHQDAGIRVSAEGASLTIYGQQNQMGQLIANGGRHSAGIGGGISSLGHDITINGGMITATGLDEASAIGGGDCGSSSNIFVNSSLVLYADSNNPPTTIIGHTTDTDVSGSISAKQYAIVRKPVKGITVTFDKQDGIGGDDQTTANENEEMPQINVPKRDGYAFYGYYAGKNGTGIKYYDPDGTSAHLWDLTENTTLYADWRDPASLVDYIDANGAKKYTCIDGEITNITSTLTDGWYIVRGADVKTKALVCEGAVHLILADDAKLTATGSNPKAGIQVSDNSASLTIYGQTHQTGQLIANGGNYASGIGGGNSGNGHNITINGGEIYATGGMFASGIGGGKEGDGHNITINGGMIHATGSSKASGIGGGDYGHGHNITINGGEIYATGGKYASGIGGGENGHGHNITINGGEIYATGGESASGIGGGDNGHGHNITINGGEIYAAGGMFASGIGGGKEGAGHDITINDGVIYATGGGDASGIGGGSGSGGAVHNITINGGEIYAIGGDKYTSAIGGGLYKDDSNIFINKALILKADGNIQPETEIEHTSTADLTSALSGKQYATLTLPSVNVNKVPEQDVNYGTFYHKYADYTVPNEDATIYTASVEDVQGETCLVLHKVEGNVIPAKTAVILRTDESSVINLQPCADASGITVPANSLSGANLPMDAPDNCYIMSYGQNGLGFYKYAQGKTLSAHKAYLLYERPAGAPALRMVFEDEEETGIETPLPTSTEGEEIIYNLQGIRLNKLQKGINIVNGKKILVK